MAAAIFGQINNKQSLHGLSNPLTIESSENNGNEAYIMVFDPEVCSSFSGQLMSFILFGKAIYFDKFFLSIPKTK